MPGWWWFVIAATPWFHLRPLLTLAVPSAVLSLAVENLSFPFTLFCMLLQLSVPHQPTSILLSAAPKPFHTSPTLSTFRPPQISLEWTGNPSRIYIFSPCRVRAVGFEPLHALLLFGKAAPPFVCSGPFSVLFRRFVVSPPLQTAFDFSPQTAPE